MNVRNFLYKKKTFVWIVLVPTIFFYFLFAYFPVVYALIMSFFRWNPLAGVSGFLGLENYENFLMHSSLFYKSLINTVQYAVVFVSIATTLGLAFAMIIYSLPGRAKAVFRTLYFIPVVSSLVAVSVVWTLIFQPRFGILNSILGEVSYRLGLNLSRINWLCNPRFAMPSVIIVVVWKHLGFNIVLYLVGLASIPKEFYEAAWIDGADKWSMFRYITLPLLSPMTLFILVIGVIGAMQIFVPIYILTGGGPVNATTTIVFLIWQEAFEKYYFGSAVAISFILFIIIMTFTIIQLRFLKTRWSY